MAPTDEQLQTSVVEFAALLKALATDLGRCETLLNEAPDVDDKQFYARVTIRCLFALIEGCTFRLKELTLRIGDHFSAEFSPSEIDLLTEKQFSPLPDNVRFAFSTFAKTCGVDFSLNTSGPGWEAFRQSVRTRNRLMHPKKHSDTLIAENEMLAASMTSKWLVDNLTELFRQFGFHPTANEWVH